MTTDKCKDSKYVVLVCILGVFLVLGSIIETFNYLDVAYLVFILFCFIRYLWICRNE